MRERAITTQRLFFAAIRVPSARRTVFVDRFAPDAEVGARVRALLDAEGGPSSSFRAPTLAREVLDGIARLGRPPDGASVVVGAPAVASDSASPVVADPRRVRPGDRFRHFRIEAELGEGGFGRVLRARDELVERDVALKVLRGDDVGPVSSADRKRFLREARALAAVVHPNVAMLYHLHTLPEDGLLMEMELVEGRTLSEELVDGTVLPLADAVAWGRGVAAGLAAAHRARLVHGDVKPANLLRTPGGVVKIVDFGLARFLGSASRRSGEIVFAGTPHFMAPEVIRGEASVPASDVWSLGVVLHRLLGGALPFHAEPVDRLFRRILGSDPPPLPPSVPERLRHLVDACLAKDPAARPLLDAAFDRALVERGPV